MRVMDIGRQSMYDTFGDKRALFLKALKMYVEESVHSISVELERPGSALSAIQNALVTSAERKDLSSAEGCMGAIGSCSDDHCKYVCDIVAPVFRLFPTVRSDTGIRQRLDTPAMFQRIVTEARAAPPYQPENPDVVEEPLPGLSIVVGHGPWLEALAVLGAQRTLPSGAVETLEKHAIDPSLHTEIVHALARQAAFLNGDCSNSDCYRMLRAFPHDGQKRQLASDVLAEQLATLPRDKFIAAIDNLRNKRASEQEPEVRIALTLSIINAQLARVRTTPVGSQLF